MVTTSLTLVLATMTGYTITRWQSFSGEFVARLTLFTYMVPSIVLILPLYMVLKSVQLTNTYPGLIASYLTFTLPFAIWIMRSHFQAIPQTMEDAALIDGATRFQAFFQVVIPQAVPGIISTGIFVFIMCWGEYLYPLVLIASDDRKTVALTLAALSGGGENIKFGLLMAGSTVATLPILVLFLFCAEIPDPRFCCRRCGLEWLLSHSLLLVLAFNFGGIIHESKRTARMDCAHGADALAAR